MQDDHSLSADDIARLPDYYENPVAVMRDGSNYVVLTDMLRKTKGGETKPVMVYLRPTREGKVDNFIASAYPREVAKEESYRQIAKTGGVLFVDKERAANIGLEEETLSQLTPSASRGPSLDSISQSSAGRNGVTPGPLSRVICGTKRKNGLR